MHSFTFLIITIPFLIYLFIFLNYIPTSINLLILPVTFSMYVRHAVLCVFLSAPKTNFEIDSFIVIDRNRPFLPGGVQTNNGNFQRDGDIIVADTGKLQQNRHRFSIDSTSNRPFACLGTLYWSCVINLRKMPAVIFLDTLSRTGPVIIAPMKYY